MKKSIILLALVFVLSIAATAFAAPANPFVDVPAKHWAYGAVTKLAQAGIVDGYGDGTFRGDKTMTRYEMAQIVAKAMAKSEKADAEQKALIDKLAVEFAAELNNLGVRVAKLEGQVGTVKVSGDARIRYFDNLAANENGTVNTQQRFQERFRLYLDSKLSNDVTFAGRIAAQWKSQEGAIAGHDPITVDYAKFIFKNAIAGADFQIGRDALGLGYGLLAGSTGQYDSFKFIGGGKEVKFWVGYGDTSSYLAAVTGTTANPSAVAATNSVDVTTANVVWTPNKEFQMTGALYWSNSKLNAAGTVAYPYEVVAVGLKYNFAKNLWLTTEYAHNSADLTFQADQNNAWFAQIGYMGADRNKPGTFGLFANYKKYGANAADWRLTSIPVFENVNDGFIWSNGVKGWGFGANYAFSKGVVGTLTHESLKSYDGSIDRPNFTYARAEFWF